MGGIGQLIVTVLLMGAEYFLGRAKDNKKMMELFHKFVERRQRDYLNSKELRDAATKGWEKLNYTEWEET